MADYTNWFPGGPHNLDDHDCVWKTYQPHGVGAPAAPGWHDVPCSLTYSAHDGLIYGQLHALCEAAKESIF